MVFQQPNVSELVTLRRARGRSLKQFGYNDRVRHLVFLGCLKIVMVAAKFGRNGAAMVSPTLPRLTIQPMIQWQGVVESSMSYKMNSRD